MIDLHNTEGINKILETIVSKYELSIVSYSFLRKSENIVYKLIAIDGSSYALRIRRIVNDYEDYLSSELNFLYHLSKGVDFEAPEPIKTNDYSLYTKIKDNEDEYACVIFKWIDGDHCKAETASFEIVGLMAESTGKFHNFSRTYKPPADFVRNIYDLEWFFGPDSWYHHQDFKDKISDQYLSTLIKFNKIIKERLENIPVNDINFGLIHYDLHAGNFKFNGKSANILDFDELGWGYYLFDLAHIIFGFINHDKYNHIKSTILKKYSETVKVPSINIFELETFIGLQCIAYMNWLYRLYWRDNNARPMERWIPEIINRIDKIIFI